MARGGTILAAILWAIAAPAVLAQDPPPPGWDEISAIFQKRCVNCHSAHGASKGLRLDSYEAVIAGSEDGAVVLAGDAPGSELVRRILGESTPRMPFLSAPLPAAEVEAIVRWVETGLSDLKQPD